jgi:hypothetical protein
VAITPAYYDMATITAVKSFIVQALAQALPEILIVPVINALHHFFNGLSLEVTLGSML